LRRRKKAGRRVDVYSSNIKRYSVYPTYRDAGQRSREARAEIPAGEVFEVRISGLDEDGRGVGSYRGYRVLVEAASPGERVRVRVKSVKGRTLYAEREE